MSCTRSDKWLLEVAGLRINVTSKNVKRINLVVMPPHGDVRISAPQELSREAIRDFANSKAEWIWRQVRAIQDRASRTEKNFEEFEIHCIWGENHRLRLYPDSETSRIEAREGNLEIYSRCRLNRDELQALLTRWHCALVREAALPLLAHWQPRAGAPQASLAVRKMKTRWGSCHLLKRKITLNSELATQAPECLEYVVVHELAHFTHPDHGPLFKGLMDRLLPEWRQIRALLA